jgi:peptidoglycan/LPS O-acetylase OafA/YrhL
VLGRLWALTAQPAHADKTRFFSIDMLRGFAAIAILLFHFKNIAAGGGNLSRAPTAFRQVSLLDYLQPIRENGSLAVMLFWAISGFVFMSVYAGTRPSARTFWVNRVARLYPLHLITLLLIAVLQIWALRLLGHWLIYDNNNLPQFILQLFFASAWYSTKIHSYNGPIWSVSVEVLVYAIFYLFVRYAPVNMRTTVGGLLAATVAATAYKSQVLVCATFFFGGMTAYLIFQLWPKANRIALLILSASVFVTLSGLGLFWGAQLRLPMTLWLLPIFCAAILFAATSEVTLLGSFYRKTHVVGDITYSTYLWHSPLQMMFLLGAGLGWWTVDIAFSNAFFVSYLLFICVFAYVSFRYIELPAQRWVREKAAGKTRNIPLIAAP